MSLGQTIQRLRKEKNLSQEAFADIMKVSRQSVSKWELDQSHPEINKLIEIADYFQITLDELLRDKLTETKKENLIEENDNSVPQASKHEEKSLIQLLRSLPMRTKLIMFIAVTLLFFFVSYQVGDYYAFIAYLCSALSASIIRRLKLGNSR